MHIVFLSPVSELGGAERVLVDLLSGLRQQRPRWRTTVCVPAEGTLSERAGRLGATVEVLTMPARFRTSGAYASGAVALASAIPGAWAYGRSMGSLLRRLAPDVVHSNGLKMHLSAGWARPASTRLVWHLHDYVGRRAAAVQLLRRTVTRVDAIVANSQSVADDARAALRSTVYLRAVLNGVDIDAFEPGGERADLDLMAGLPPAPLPVVRVGLVATYARWKGHKTFLRAVAALPAHLPVRAYIVGGPIYDTAGSQHTRQELEAEAGRIGVSTRVGFVDFVEQPAAVYRALDVVVHASTEPEPFGLVVAEAMACGRAVVASRAGGVEEIVQQGIDGMTHRAGDAADLAAVVRRLVHEPDLRRRLGAEARCSAERYLTTTRMTREFCQVYERVVLGADAVEVPA